MPFRVGALLVLLAASAETSVSFSPAPHPSIAVTQSNGRTLTKLGAMERLHDPSSNAYGTVEHVYSLRDIDRITRKISDDEWTALGSVVAEEMLEMILDVGCDALMAKGWAGRTSLTERIAEEVASAVENAFLKIRSQPSGSFEHGLPEELLTTLNTLLRHELGAVAGLEDDQAFDYSGRDLSLVVLSAVTDAVESYCGVDNVDAPFFDLSREMERRVRDRRRELLLKHSRGYENVRDVEEDIRTAREEWVREELGGRAAATYEFGEVTTHAGNARGHNRERRARKGRREGAWSALFQDLDGALMP